MKTAIITGASKGIGLAAARWFLDNGYRVINFSRSPAPDARVENEALDLTVADAEDRVNERIASLVDASHPICVVHNAAVMTNDTTGATDAAAGTPNSTPSTSNDSGPIDTQTDAGAESPADSNPDSEEPSP